MQKIWREELRSIEIDDCSYDSILSWAWCTVSKDILSRYTMHAPKISLLLIEEE